MERGRLPRHCYNCTKIFYPRLSDVKEGGGKYCSKECMWEWGNCIQRGIMHSCYGKSKPEEVKKKISNTLQGEGNPNYGKPCPKERREKIRLGNIGKKTGESHPRWKGGITQANKLIRNSNEYKLWKLAVLERDNRTCVNCGSQKKVCAHHILDFLNYPEERFAIDNGITWCKPCHLGYHFNLQ